MYVNRELAIDLRHKQNKLKERAHKLRAAMERYVSLPVNDVSFQVVAGQRRVDGRQAPIPPFLLLPPVRWQAGRRGVLQ